MKGFFKLSLALVASAISVATSPALRAQTNENIGVIADTIGEVKARADLYRMADCIRKGMPSQVEDLLAYNIPPAPKLAAMLYSQSCQRCTPRAGGFKTDVLIGSLFRSVYLEREGGQPLAPDDLRRSGIFISEHG